MVDYQRFVLRVELGSRPCPRPRSVAGRTPYLPAAYAEWRTEAAIRFGAAWRRVRPPSKGAIDTPVSLSVFLARRSITVWVDPAEGCDRDGLRGDLDNHLKAVLDALVEAGVLADDRLVLRLAGAFAPAEGGTGDDRDGC